jgi:hypothetical protein
MWMTPVLVFDTGSSEHPMLVDDLSGGDLRNIPEFSNTSVLEAKDVYDRDLRFARSTPESGVHRHVVSFLQGGLDIQAFARVPRFIFFHSRSERLGITGEIWIVVPEPVTRVSFVRAANIAGDDLFQEINRAVLQSSCGHCGAPSRPWGIGVRPCEWRPAVCCEATRAEHGSLHSSARLVRAHVR